MVSTRSRSNSIAVANVVPTTASVVAAAVLEAIVESPTGTTSTNTTKSDIDLAKNTVETSLSTSKSPVNRSETKQSKRQANMKKKEQVDNSTQLLQQQQQLLRMKSTGKGINIPIHSDTAAGKNSINTPTNRKIVFAEEDDVIDPDIHNNNKNDDIVDMVYDAIKSSQKNVDDDNENDDDDDIVEEVQGVTAKDQILHDLQQQRLAQTKPKKKKHRNNKRTLSLVSGQPSLNGENENDVDEMLDDSFFQQLEQDQKNELQRTKKQKSRTNETTHSVSKHTTFVVVDNDSSTNHHHHHHHHHCILEDDVDNTVATKHNDSATNPNTIVVVLNDNSIYTNTNDSSIRNDTISYYSRLGCIDPIRGTMTTTLTTQGGSGRSKTKPNDPTTSAAVWTRSKQMNRILALPSHIRRRGKAAVQFTTKTTTTNSNNNHHKERPPPLQPQR